MIKTRSDALIVWNLNTAPGAAGGSVTITNSSALQITNTSLTVLVQNSSGWIFAQSNTAGESTYIINSAGWIVSVANTSPLVSIQNSAGWLVNASSTILNSAGWVVAQSNTAGMTVNVINSAGWVVNVANTGGVFTILNSGGLYAQQSGAWAVSSTILNSGGWIVAQSNTGGAFTLANSSALGATILNSGGLYAMQSGLWTVAVGSVSIVNSAGWVVAVSNTAGITTNIINSAGWSVLSIESGFTGSVSAIVASTVGTVILADVRGDRRVCSVYNRSVNPLFLKLGSGAKTTDFTVMLVASGYYEVPNPVYRGVITGVWGTADGDAQVMEGT